jgi:hypothetical protein
MSVKCDLEMRTALVMNLSTKHIKAHQFVKVGITGETT